MAKFHEYGLWFAHYLRQQELNDRPHMLIVDSHSSHLYNLLFYQVMKANNIHVFTIPPHTSHILQPLDSTPFAIFKRHWKINLMKYNSAHHGRSLNKVDLWDVFTPSFNSAMIPKNILSGFRKTGISPYDPSAISIESLMPSQVTEKGDGEITLHPIIDFLHSVYCLFYFPVVCCLLKSISSIPWRTFLV